MKLECFSDIRNYKSGDTLLGLQISSRCHKECDAILSWYFIVLRSVPRIDTFDSWQGLTRSKKCQRFTRVYGYSSREENSPSIMLAFHAALLRILKLDFSRRETSGDRKIERVDVGKKEIGSYRWKSRVGVIFWIPCIPIRADRKQRSCQSNLSRTTDVSISRYPECSWVKSNRLQRSTTQSEIKCKTRHLHLIETLVIQNFPFAS